MFLHCVQFQADFSQLNKLYFDYYSITFNPKWKLIYYEES